ncbi:MAG: hypothetical protein K0S53_1271 [Bacteroidetes bacterium]|jgi:hypothetical protein|nr:hypothetical protein [Bacteroidota bacterium]
MSGYSQDRILKRESDYDIDIDENLKISNTTIDTIYYVSYGKSEKIATKDIVAFKKNYANSKVKYYYPKPSDERIYGIKNDILYHKTVYLNDTENPELSKEAFLEQFRVYDSVIPKNKSGDVFLENNISHKRKRLHENVKLYLYFKNDQFNRKFKGKIYNICKDSSTVIMKIGVSGEKHIYLFRNSDIKTIGMEAPAAFITRHTLALVSLSSGVFAWTSAFYYKNKWCRKFDFDKWHLSK